MSCTDSKATEQATVMPPMRCPQVNSDVSQCEGLDENNLSSYYKCYYSLND